MAREAPANEIRDLWAVSTDITAPAAAGNTDNCTNFTSNDGGQTGRVVGAGSVSRGWGYTAFPCTTSVGVICVEE